MKSFCSLFTVFLLLFVGAPAQNDVIDGVAAIVDEHIILKSDVAQMLQMTLIQQRIDPQTNPEQVIKLQDEILQSMVDQKIILEMAKLDSIEVKDKEVAMALDQQIENMIAQAGSEARVEEAMGQSIKSLRREYREDMRDRLITERYQQQLISAVMVSRHEVESFFTEYRDSLPPFPTQVQLSHILLLVEAGPASQAAAVQQINALREEIVAGGDFASLAQDYSMDPGSAGKGGDLGLVRRGSLVPEFESVAFTLPEMEISEPVKTQFGYHLIQPMEHQGEKIRVRHILITPEVTEDDDSRAYYSASDLRDSIKTYEDFVVMAKKYSRDDETSALGGDLGWVNPQDFPIPEVAEVINYLELGQCSPPVKTSFGYHLFWIKDIKTGGRPSLETHWPDLEQIALNNKQMDWYSDWIAEARQNFYIQIMN